MTALFHEGNKSTKNKNDNDRLKRWYFEID